MLFSSIPFLFYFLPVVLLLYFLAPAKLKNGVLLLSSLIFYGWGEPRYVLLMVISILLGYLFGRLIESFRGRWQARLFVVLSVAVSLGLLGYFKYTDFFLSNFNAVTGLSLPLLKISLPIGISFYTFQLLSYTIDVYRGDTPAQRDPVAFGAYISMFPQLIAGPIVRYTDIAPQLHHRTHNMTLAAEGARRFILGLSKKILIANLLGELCDVFRQSQAKSVVFYWVYAAALMLQIYFDFSGYSDMAIGLGKLFGFSFIENFNYPFVSKSIAEFWRRWHISLGSWFRDYVYIPLGGNRVKLGGWLRNVLIVWMLTGLWHGAAWNFVLWGLLFAVLLTVEKLGLGKLLKRAPAALARVYVLFFLLVSFVLFNAASLGQAAADVGGMLGFSGAPLLTAETLYALRSYGVVLVIAVAASLPYGKRLALRFGESPAGRRILPYLQPAALCILLLLNTAYLVDGSFNPFLYFRF